MANRERNKKILLELAKQSENNRCADCGAPGEFSLFTVPVWSRMYTEAVSAGKKTLQTE